MQLTNAFPLPVRSEDLKDGDFILASQGDVEAFGVVCGLNHQTWVLVLGDDGEDGVTPRLQHIDKFDGAMRKVEGDVRLEPTDQGLGVMITENAPPHGSLRVTHDGDVQFYLRDEGDRSWFSLTKNYVAAEPARLGKALIYRDWQVSLYPAEGAGTDPHVLAIHEPR